MILGESPLAPAANAPAIQFGPSPEALATLKWFALLCGALYLLYWLSAHHSRL